MNNNIIILGIESSCDDTAAAIIQNGTLLSNIVANQDVHKLYGGVVPELASRAHQQNIIPVVHRALDAAKVNKNELSAIAYTQGPGLMGSLLVGNSFAKSMAMALDIPLIEVNHMQGHILAHFIDDADKLPHPPFPFLCLTVSGGHTQIVLVKNYLDTEIIGETKDDAAGEAFDKAAKILGLPYPGGPLIDKYAKLGNPSAFPLPWPEMPGYNFSFSGLKTSFLNFITKQQQADNAFIERHLNDICASLQHTIIHILMSKLAKAAKEKNIKHIAIAGGVSANSGLREALNQAKDKYGWTVYIPKFEYCTDNAGMIAITGYYKYKQQLFASKESASNPRLTMQ